MSRGDAELLLPREVLLASGVHIGTRIKTGFMEPFIYRVRPDGLFILDLGKMSERIRVAAKFLSRFEPSRVVVVASRRYAMRPVQKFCELTGFKPIAGRFTAGTFTNPMLPEYVEPDVVLVTDPVADRQAIVECVTARIPVVAICSTEDTTSNIDLVIPANNKGRRALATVYWLLCREVLRERGELGREEDLAVPIEEFESPLE